MVFKPSDVGSGTMSHLANLILRQYGVVVALAMLLIAMGIGSPSFLTVKNLLNILSQWTPVGIMAVGATYVIIAGGFDLSAAAGFALCAVVMASLASNGAPPALSILAALAVGIFVGCMNALVVVALRVDPFMATLGTALILSGVPNVLVERTYIIVQQPGFDTLGTGSGLGYPTLRCALSCFWLSAVSFWPRHPMANGYMQLVEMLRLVAFSGFVWVGGCLHLRFFWVLYGRSRRDLDLSSELLGLGSGSRTYF